MRLKLTFSCCSLWTSYYFVIESIDSFYFVNHLVVYKAVLLQGKDGKLVYKIFIVNVVLMHLLSNLTVLAFSKVTDWHFLGRLMDWATGGIAQVADKAQRWGFKSMRAPCGMERHTLIPTPTLWQTLLCKHPILTKKGFFYQKRCINVHLPPSLPLYWDLFQGFTTKYIFVNVSWKWAELESHTHFLSRLGTGSLLQGTFPGGGGMSKILSSAHPYRKEKPNVPPKIVKNFKPPIWLSCPQG